MFHRRGRILSKEEGQQIKAATREANFRCLLTFL